jgi:hypothetical protein
MVNWRVTEVTIYCDGVDDDVTIQVYKDGSMKCTGYGIYGEHNKNKANLLKKKSRQLGRQLKCVGPECDRMIQYKDKLFSEEAG